MSPEVASKEVRAASQWDKTTGPAWGQAARQPLPHWFLPPVWRSGCASCLTVACIFCTEVSPARKQQLPAWLSLHDCKCQQTKEHNSEFIFISSSMVSWYFHALQALIKDLAIRNLKEHFRAGSSSAARVYQIKCNSTDIPALPTNHRGGLLHFHTWRILHEIKIYSS